MEFFFEKCRALSPFSSKTKIETKNQVRCNSYIENVYKVLSWNNPFISWCSFIVVNYIFWLMIWLELKLLGLMFLLVAILFIYDYLFCNNRISVGNLQDTHEHQNDIEQFIYAVNSAFSNICTIRNENPSVFCLAMSLFFLVMSLIARNMSGVVLAYLTILGIFFLPLAYKNLPLQLKYGLKKTIKSAFNFQDIIAEDDLIPVQTAYKVEGVDDWENLETDKTAESVTNSLISGISSMPSFMDPEDNNEILEEDLIPLTTQVNKEMTPGVGDFSSDSDSEIREMRFKESHVSKDTSSDEGSKFEEGLVFSEETVDSNRTIQNKKSGLYNVFINCASALSMNGISLPTFMSTVLNTEQRSISTRKSSTSESDFELVNHEDVKQ